MKMGGEFGSEPVRCDSRHSGGPGGAREDGAGRCRFFPSSLQQPPQQLQPPLPPPPLLDPADPPEFGARSGSEQVDTPMSLC
ncbi:hypothetical protein OJAV_G00012350 [Oryzias javanicus]|uniref:Uncharacterized protein n=1 Tax=Oryzias javanicus TaxID=123683 RepID=A0A3S2N8K8_ORYJA|nr:hypothetical protein OJAV_G00012350 [Oryzias javanicus]